MSDILDETPHPWRARRDAIVQAACRCVWKKASPEITVSDIASEVRV